MTNPEIPAETVELATIAWYEATPGVSWEDAGKYERAAMLSRSKLILEAALPHLRVQETPAADALETFTVPYWINGEHVSERIIGALLAAGLVDPDTGEVYTRNYTDDLDCAKLAQLIITHLRGENE